MIKAKELKPFMNYLQAIRKLISYCDGKMFDYKEKFGVNDIMTNYYSGLVGVLNYHMQAFNSCILYFLIFKDIYPLEAADNSSFEKKINKIIKNKINYGKVNNKEGFALSLKILSIIGIGVDHFYGIVNGGLLNLYSNVRSVFECSLESLFKTKYPDKIEQKQVEEIKKISKLLGIDSSGLTDEQINQLKKHIKEYPFTNKLGTIISFCPTYKKIYQNEGDEVILNEVYETRNSQHNRGIRKNGKVKKTDNLEKEIVELKKFIDIFEKIFIDIYGEDRNIIEDGFSIPLNSK